MSVHLDDVRRGCAERRARGATTPARVRVPAAVSAAAIVAAAATVALVRPSAVVGIAVVLGVAVLAAVATRRTLTSIAAGAGLRLARPYCPGEQVRVYVPAYARTVEAEVVRVGFANTTLMTGSGLLVLPNSRMLRAAPERRAA